MSCRMCASHAAQLNTALYMSPSTLWPLSKLNPSHPPHPWFAHELCALKQAGWSLSRKSGLKLHLQRWPLLPGPSTSTAPIRTPRLLFPTVKKLLQPRDHTLSTLLTELCNSFLHFFFFKDKISLITDR